MPAFTARRARFGTAAIGLLVGLAGCASSGTAGWSGPRPQPVGTRPAPVASTAPKPAPTPAGRTAAAALAATAAKVKIVGLTQADLPTDFTVRLAPRGQQVAGSVSLDLCQHRFSTEAHRTARREVAVYYRGRDAGIANETIGYDSPARAALALREWRAGAAGCARRQAARPYDAHGRHYGQLRLVTEPALPAADNAVTTAVVSPAPVAGRTRQVAYAVVLQRSGAVLDVIVGYSAQLSAAEVARLLTRLAQTTGLRLTTP